MAPSARCRTFAALLLACIALPFASPAIGQTVSAPFDADYNVLDLGTPTGLVGRLGGVTLLAGDSNTLLIGGFANGPAGAIYRIGLVRDAERHITGFSGSATIHATAPEIDGGLAYGPGGVLFYTGYNENLLGQIAPGSAAPDKIVDLGALGVARSVGTLQFVPAGFPGAGGLRIASYSQGRFYSATLAADGAGTWDVTGVTAGPQLAGAGPEGIVYVPPGSPGFTSPAMLVSEFGTGSVAAYDVDAQGMPVPASRRAFLTGLDGAMGAFIDPLSGDFVFSTFGGANRVIVVGGFAAPVPEPAHAVLLIAGLLVVAAARARRPGR